MNLTKECIAIVVSAPSLDKATLQQSLLARELSNAKIAARQDVVSMDRFNDAKRQLLSGMRSFFHQGGAPSRWARQVPNCGRLTAAAILDGFTTDLNSHKPLLDPNLLVTTMRIFPGWTLGGYLWFSRVKLVPSPPLTKSLVKRPPLPGQNYIVVCPGDEPYNSLLRIWDATYAGLQPEK